MYDQSKQLSQMSHSFAESYSFMLIEIFILNFLNYFKFFYLLNKVV